MIIKITVSFLCVVVIVFGSGCFVAEALFTAKIDYGRVSVQVIDGDTGRPVPNAEVFTPPGQWGAKGDSATADAAGRATLRIAKYVGGDIDARSRGYLVSASSGEAGARDVKVHIYRRPMPLAGLTVPTDFRGPLRVGSVAGEAALPSPPPPGPPWLDGKRTFYTVADVKGITRIAPPPKLTQVQAGAEVFLARFDDGTALRYENPTARTGWSGENVFALPDVRNLAPPRDDGVALFKLGSRYDIRPPTTREAIYYRYVGEGYGVYFVGTLDEAAIEQQRLLTGAMPEPKGRAQVVGYTFRPEPLEIDKLEVGTQLSPLYGS